MNNNDMGNSNSVHEFSKEVYMERKNSLSELKVTRKEQRAMILGALSVILPAGLLIIGLYFGAFLLLYLWM